MGSVSGYFYRAAAWAGMPDIAKTAKFAAFAMNLVTLVSSFQIGNRLMRDPDLLGLEVVGGGIAAPVLMAKNWQNDPSWVGGGTVVNAFGAAASKLPTPVNGALNAAFTLVGIPGAWLGYESGAIVGAFMPSVKPSPCHDKGPCPPF